MRRWIAAGIFVVTAAGLGVWQLWPEPPPVADVRYEDIPTEEYEAWMRELGYTE